MKTATYTKLGGNKYTIEYDENAPCATCHEPVVEASMSGTAICPWCDGGQCRYCGVQSSLLKGELDGGRSLRKWREHMVWHRDEQKKVRELEQ